MDEQARFWASHNGYKGLMTRLFNRIEDLLSGEFDDYSATLLGNAHQ